MQANSLVQNGVLDDNNFYVGMRPNFSVQTKHRVILLILSAGVQNYEE